MDKTKQIIDWYIQEGKGSYDINLLLEKQGELAGYSFHLAEYVSTQHKLFITSEHERKVEYNQKIVDLMAEGGTKGGSECKALLITAKKRLEEKYHEIQYQDAKLHLQQVNQVLGAFQMRIAFLRKELDQSGSAV